MMILILDEQLGKRCKEARIRSNISLRKASFEMGYSPAAVSRFENGKRIRINPKMLIWYRDNTDLFNGS